LPEFSSGMEKETLMSRDDAAFEKMLSALPVTTYRAGETILRDGSKTGRLLILKSGEVAVLKNSVELARVDQPGAVLPDQPCRHRDIRSYPYARSRIVSTYRRDTAIASHLMLRVAV